MAWFDMPLEQLREYNPEIIEPNDFDDFWQATLSEFTAEVPEVSFDRLDDELYQTIDVYFVTFSGYAGDPIQGWLILPKGGENLPCVVSYIGYGGGMGEPLDHVGPSVAGFAYFVMDTRGQGAGWAPGRTPDPVGSHSAHPGFMTRGIEQRETYYFRRVYTDAVCAVRAVAQHPRIDVQNIAVSGGSQGGGLAIAAASLSGDAVKACCTDVPFMCHFSRAITMTDSMPYAEIANYLKIHRKSKERVLKTLSYFDCVSLAARIKAPTLFSVALMDQVCPPSTIFAAFNGMSAEKEIAVYEFNQHEGGGSLHVNRRLKFCREHLISEGGS